jgi:AraC-like DNA-binding protein
MTAATSRVPRIEPTLMRLWRVDIRRRLERIGLRCWELDLPPGFRAPRHEHERAHFGVLLAGSLEASDRGYAMTYRRMLHVFHPAGIVHVVRAGEAGARVLTLELSEAWERRIDGLGRLPDAPVALAPEHGHSIARRLLGELRAPEPCSILVLESLALELLAAALRVPRESDEPQGALHAAIERVRDGLGQPLRLREVAEHVGIHPARLTALFRVHTGLGFGDYVRELRVQLVLERLRDPDEPLANVALAAGFADQAHCTRIFKTATGWTPGRYRAALQRRETGAVSGSAMVYPRLNRKP